MADSTRSAGRVDEGLVVEVDSRYRAAIGRVAATVIEDEDDLHVLRRALTALVTLDNTPHDIGHAHLMLRRLDEEGF